MQYVEFAGLDEDADEDELNLNGNGDALGLQLPDPNADKANAQRGKSLEALLATKNKRILEELTKFRVCDQISSTAASLLCVCMLILSKWCRFCMGN